MRELLVIPQHTLKECFFKGISQYNRAIHTMKKKKLSYFRNVPVTCTYQLCLR